MKRLFTFPRLFLALSLAFFVFAAAQKFVCADGLYEAASEGQWSYGTRVDNEDGSSYCIFTRTADRCITTCPYCNPHLSCGTNNGGGLGPHYLTATHALVGGMGGCNYIGLDNGSGFTYYGSPSNHKVTTFTP